MHRKRYLRMLVEGEQVASSEPNLELLCFPRCGNSGRAPDWMAYVQWTLYEITGEQRHAGIAKRMIVGPREPWRAGGTYHREEELLDEFCHYPFGHVYVGLREAGMLSAEEEEFARQRLGRSLRFWQEYPTYFSGSTELDVGNLGITLVCGADYAARHIFCGEFAESLRSFADRVWTGYWRVGDCLEDAVNYEILHMVYMPIWAQVRNEMEALQNYVRHGTYDRAFQQILPMGAVCDHGDSGWQAGWAGSLATFEIAATVTSEGRYAWLAQRMTDYVEQSGYLRRFHALLRDAHTGRPLVQSLPGAWAQEAFFLCQAYRWCAEDVKAAEPQGRDSTLTYRYRPALEAAWEETRRGVTGAAMTLYPHHRGERHEDKLVLRSGYEADANHLIASLDRPAWHDHQDAGAVLTWTHHGAVYLHGPFYHQREAIAHNLVYVADLDTDHERDLGTTYFYRARTKATRNNRCVTTFIEDFAEIAMVGYRSVQFYDRLAVWERTLLFPRDGTFLLVVDEIANRGDDLWSAPLWHFEKMHRQTDWWADCEHTDIPGGVDNFWPVAPQRVLVAFPLRENPLRHLRQVNADFEPRGAKTVADLERDWSQQSLVYQTGNLPQGGRVRFISLLLPHDIDEPPEDAASRIRVVAQEEESWCLEMAATEGGSSLVGMVPPRLPAFYQRPRPDHLGFQPSWRTEGPDVEDPHGDRSLWFTAGGITTDAEIFYVKQTFDRSYVAARRMRAFEMGGLKHHAQVSPCWPPTRFQVNAEFILEPGKSRARYSCRNYNPIELTFGHPVRDVQVTGGVNGIPSTAEVDGGVVRLALNGVAEVTVQD